MLIKAMMSPVVIVLVLMVTYWVVVYNGLVNGRNQIRRAFSGIDVQLKKRWDLIPQLVNVVKGYAKHEAELFEKIAEARADVKSATRGSELSQDRLGHEQKLAEHTLQVIAVAERYPELKASEQFIMLQRNLTEVEAQIAASRRSYNAYVVKYNNSVESFPSNIVANQHGFKEADYFEINLTERQNVRL